MIKHPNWFPVMLCLLFGTIRFTTGHAQIHLRPPGLSAFHAENPEGTHLCFASGNSYQGGHVHSQSVAALNEKSLREDFTIFPSSAKGNVTLKYFTQRHAAFQIYDASGRLMFFRILDQGENLLHLKTSLPEGVYIYTINDRSGYVLKTAKLVVVK